MITTNIKSDEYIDEGVSRITLYYSDGSDKVLEHISDVMIDINGDNSVIRFVNCFLSQQLRFDYYHRKTVKRIVIEFECVEVESWDSKDKKEILDYESDLKFNLFKECRDINDGNSNITSYVSVELVGSIKEDNGE